MPQTLGLIGVGAFGAFALPHLAPHFEVRAFDSHRDLAPVLAEAGHGARAASLAETAAAEVVVLAVPIQRLATVADEIADFLRPGCLVLDVASVKIKPLELLAARLPAFAALVGTHPLFGPQSGKAGIRGLNVALCDVRGERSGCVASFLADKLGLNVIVTSPERHDREVAFVQGLTHLIARIFNQIELPDIRLTTRTYELLHQSLEMVRYDSDELFTAIETENPFVHETVERFFDAARRLEERLEKT